MKYLSQIYIYPIKSLGGIRLEQSKLTPRGLQYDRRFMLTTPEGKFFTQRKIAQMAIMRLAIEGENLKIWHQNQPNDVLTIPLQPTDFQKQQKVQIWRDTCVGSVMEASINQWFSNKLNTDCQLVYMADDSIRPIDPDWRKEGEKVSFADGYPFLVLSQAAMDNLNQKMEDPVPIDRFRPNLVISGALPHEEDKWKYFKIGAATFRGVKPCARCGIPNINQQTATIEKEPNRTLATYRRFEGNKIYFGMNTCWEKEMSNGNNEVKVGDGVEEIAG